MAAGLNWNLAHAFTDDPDVDHGRSTIVVQQNKAVLRAQGGTIIAERPLVVSVTNVRGEPQRRDVTFEDGTVWRVTRRTGGCGCGR